MNIAEILLLILGFMSVSISFFMGNREKSKVPEGAEEDTFSRDIWTEKEEELVRDQVTRILKEERENVVVETTNLLNRRSNEKIMEFDEFSSQLMAKINHNHDEVVFMYNMLTEKEKEWKEAAAQSKAKPQSEAKPESDAPVRRPMDVQVPKETAPVPSPSVTPAPEVKPVKRQKVVGNDTVSVSKNAAKQATGLEQLTKRAKEAADAVPRKPGREPDKTAIAEQPSGVVPEQAAAQMEKMTETTENGSTDNVNNRIVKMYRQGKSVVEISKLLNVGQGEVKLTIALYGGNR